MLKIIKIGGGIIDNPTELKDFLHTFSQIEGPKVLIHGGGKGASKMLQKLGIEPKMIEAREQIKHTIEQVDSILSNLK